MINIYKDNKKIYIYILLAFIFSVGVRMIWVQQLSGLDGYYWNNQLMINTNDGYYFAEGARDVLAGSHQENDLSPINEPASLLTAWIAKVLPFSFESIILFLPAFLSSFLVIPLVLIGKSLKSAELGFIAALLGSIAWSYYNRTMTGYYDTDMLNVVLPTFLLWALVLSVDSREDKYLLFTAFSALLYRWWYPQSYSLEFAFFGLILLYTLVFERKNDFLYKLLVMVLVSMLSISILLKIPIVIVLFALFKRKISLSIVLAILGISVLAFLFTGGVDPIIAQVKGYVIRDSVVGDAKDGLDLHFFSVAQTVREAGKIPFEVFANRISGNMITFFVSLIGYGWLCFKHRVMLLGLPMLGLGFLAYSSGLRFTVYAVPVMALGVAYLIVKIGDIIENKSVRYGFMVFATFWILLPNVLHVKDYKVPTVFNKEEVKVIGYLKKHASREDYVVSWWDYGYPLRYYGDVKTLVDGGKHSGDVNFAPSFILTNPQQVAAKMARLDVEYTEKSFKEQNQTESNMAKMLKDYGFKDINDFLLSLQSDITLPKKTRDIYFYLPYRMMGIYPTIARFSLIDLMSGDMGRDPFFYKANQLQDRGNTLYLGTYMGNDISLDKQKSVIMLGKNKIPVKEFCITDYKNGKLVVKKQSLHPNGYLAIIYAKAYNAFYVLGLNVFYSTYVQLFFLENYDKNLYEPIVLNPYSKLYKLKD